MVGTSPEFMSTWLLHHLHVTGGSVSDEKMAVVGGGASGIYAAIRAKTFAPNLNVIVIEKAKPLAKVKISGGGRCNVTNGHCVDNRILVEKYPRGSKEFRGSFFNVRGPNDTMSWFSDHGVELKTEEDERVFSVSDNSSTIVDYLLNEARRRGVTLQTGKSVTSASTSADGSGQRRSAECKASEGSEDQLSAKHQLVIKGLADIKASASNLRDIQVRDIVKEVEDYLKTYSSAEMDIEDVDRNTLKVLRRVRGDNTLMILLPFE
ncbi:FAD/NAD(P)-binding oxidoreductase family protein [Tanacetum coccineum]